MNNYDVYAGVLMVTQPFKEQTKKMRLNSKIVANVKKSRDVISLCMMLAYCLWRAPDEPIARTRPNFH